MVDPTRRSKLTSCAIFAAIPFVVILGLVIVFLINNRPLNIHVPTPKMPKDNGWDHFVRAANLIKGVGQASSTQPSSYWTLARHERFMQDNAAAIAALRLGLTKPYMHPPIRDFQSLDFTSYLRIRELARVMVSASIYYDKIGEPYAASSARMDALELGATIPRGGPLITDIEGSSIQLIALRGVESQILKLSADEPSAIANRLNRIESKRVPYADVVLEEGRACAAFDAVEMRSTIKPVPYPMSGLPGASSKVDVAKYARYLLQNKTALLRENRDYYTSLAAECRKPYTGKSRIRAPKNLLFRSLFQSMAKLYSDDGYAAHLRPQAVTAVLRTEIALLRYHGDHGKYPAGLTHLTPKYLKAVPVDPFGQGKLLIYRPATGGKSFLLYSRGMDMKDDGGKPANWTWIGSKTKGDYVAGRLD